MTRNIESIQTIESVLQTRKTRKMVTKETIKSFKTLIEREKSQKEIMDTLSISKSTFQRLRRKYETGELDNIKDFKTFSENKKETKKDKSALKEFLAFSVANCPNLALSAIRENIVQNNSNNIIHSSVPTICRTLKEMNYTRKVLTKIPINRNSAENKNIRCVYGNELANISDNNLIFVDETGFNLHLAPRRGYSPINQKCFINVPNSKGTNVSLLCAISVHGIVAWAIKIGPFDSEAFRNFIINEMPVLSNGENKILIMDNAAIHKTATVRDALMEKRYLFKFLPPYSPQLNPIEEFFSCIKARYSRYARPLNRDDVKSNVTDILSNGNFNMHGYFSHMRSYITKARNREDFI